MNDKPWLAHYDRGVPHTVEIPNKPLFHFLEESAQIVCEVVQLEQELLLGLRPENLRQFAYAARVGFDLVELVAEKRLQLLRMLLEGYERLQDFEDPCLIAALQSS